jgi:hypothetical protein
LKSQAGNDLKVEISNSIALKVEISNSIALKVEISNSFYLEFEISHGFSISNLKSQMVVRCARGCALLLRGGVCALHDGRLMTGGRGRAR